MSRQYILDLEKINQQIFLNENVAYAINFDKFVNNLSRGTHRDKTIDYSTFYAQELPSYYDLMNEKLKKNLAKNFFAPFLVDCVRKQQENSVRTIREILEYQESTKHKTSSQVKKQLQLKQKQPQKESRSSSFTSEISNNARRPMSAIVSYTPSKKSLPSIDSSKKKRVKSAFPLSSCGSTIDDSASLGLCKSIRRERANAETQADKYREKLKVAKLAKQFILYNKYYCTKRCDLRNE